MYPPELAVAPDEGFAVLPLVALSPHLSEVTHLAALGVGEASAAAGEITEALRHLCDAARRQGLRVEQLLILVKEAWAATNGRVASAERSKRDERLDLVVTLCIEEFYRSGN